TTKQKYKEDAMPVDEEKVQTEPGGLLEDCFFENIDDMLGLLKQKLPVETQIEGTTEHLRIIIIIWLKREPGSTLMNEEIADTSKTDQAPNYEQDDMQTDKVLHELHAESDKPAPNEEISHDTLILYGKVEVTEKLQPKLDRNKLEKLDPQLKRSVDSQLTDYKKYEHIPSANTSKNSFSYIHRSSWCSNPENPLDTSGGVNKENKNIIPQQAEQTKG
ncbi:4442_t:CDS:2, partial [Gigaspora margarita]